MNNLYDSHKLRPIIIAEKGKWYNLKIAFSNGTFKDLDFDQLEECLINESKTLTISTAFCDHVPNPMAVCLYAAVHNYQIDSKSLAEITRRWYNEYYDSDIPLKKDQLI